MSTKNKGKNDRVKHTNFGGVSRREFLKTTMKAGVVLAGSDAILNSSENLVQLVAMKKGTEEFMFAYISDSHLLARGKEHRFARALIKAVKDVNAMSPQPDFVLYGGDLAQLGLREELSLGRELIAPLKPKCYMMVGEHDWYYDMGEAWREFFGQPTYSFDHKGVHFIVLNSVIVEDYWSATGMSPMERMLFMAQLDNPKGRPFTVGEEQRKWLKDDLSRVSKATPVVVFSHSPLYKYYKPWNFWTDDAEKVQQLLMPFKSVTVIHGHTHQVLTNKIKNMAFHGMLSTAWPWPYAPEGIPALTIQMDRADPFNQFDGTGWGTAEIISQGNVNKTYHLWDRNPMVISYEKLSTSREPVSGPSY
ncbi:MAG: serine/threonine protein phosphatase [Candidatus Brocadia sp. UTAMX2]|jgi:3',5'-cyclic AMP phosphodiesterase CpdA|nr:MAG: serine/threonine protein phosphatase [Candidatus Brocadia sp. UTAMX2]